VGVRIASVEVIPYGLPFREAYVTATGVLERREMVLLRLRTEEGLVGLGEAVPLSLRGGASLSQVVAELEALGESGVLQRMVEQGETGEAAELGDAVALSPPARCAALTALIDLGEKRGELGDQFERQGPGGLVVAAARHDPGPVPCNATLVAGPPEAVAENALRWTEDGFSTVKLKLGTGDDVAQVRAVREAVGAECKIRVDANGVWSLETARRILERLEPLDVELVEQPVGRIEDAARLAWETCIPLAADEGVASRADAEQALLLGAYRLTGIKLSKVGGYSEGKSISGLLHGYVSSALDGPVGIAIGARLAQTIDWEGANPYAPRLAHGLATQRLFASTIAAVECRLEGGMLHMPEGPGLGVEIDEEALAAHRL
jgi:L-alanine-DL-glutamate epimerase-like enolase superfamily enzyme